MDYQEAYQKAIDTLKNEIKCSCYRNLGYCGICTIYSEMDRDNIISACKFAISAMQELQLYKNSKLCLIPEDVFKKQCEELDAYKEIGTLEEIKLLKATHLTGVELAQIYCMQKQLAEYEKIGTLEEVREAVEKQRAKKVSIEDVGYNQYRNVNLYACICTSCGLHIIEFDDDDVCESDSDNPAEMFRDCLVHHGYEWRNNYCNRCGNKLDWSEVEE